LTSSITGWWGESGAGSAHRRREIVENLSTIGGVAHVIRLTNGPDDAACCPTARMTGDLRWNGKTVVAEDVRELN